MLSEDKANLPVSRNKNEKDIVIYFNKDNLDNESKIEFINVPNEIKNKNSLFNISAYDLENLMGKYKERGVECLDI